MNAISFTVHRLVVVAAVSLICIPIPLGVANAVTLECLLVTNAPLTNAKQPRALVARMTFSWVDHLIAEEAFMMTTYTNFTNPESEVISGIYGMSQPAYHYTTQAAASGVAQIYSNGAAITPFGYANGDACAVEGPI